MDIANNSYYVIHSLVGGNRPFGGARMRLETSRNLPPWAAGTAGQPILMAVNPSPQWSMIYTARLMNRHNVDMTVLPIHEIAHNFQRASWNFEPEALAVLKTHYFLERTNTSIVIPHRDFPIRGGAGYRYYMRNWGAGSLSYNDAMSLGIYSPYMLGYNLTGIAGRIGWEPFRQTFRAFEALPPSQVPNTSLGKMNLFLSMLTDFSGQNVFGMFTPAEQVIYERYFGGRLEYVTVQPPNFDRLGVVFNNNILRPIVSANEANVEFFINYLDINPTNRWLTYNILIQTSTQRFGVGGGKLVFNNPSLLRQGEAILGTSVGVIGEWEIMLTIERAANPAFLLPINQERLGGQTVAKFTVRNNLTGNIYYLEALLPNPSLFAQYQAIAFNPSDANRNSINSSVHWYLNSNTIHGPANGQVSTGDQAGFAYNLTRIRQAIGHQPFNQAFAYFANLSPANMPNTPLGRTNLFLTKLRDFSGVNVLGLLSPQARLNIEARFGGRLEYVTPQLTIPQGLNWIVSVDNPSNMMFYVTEHPVSRFGTHTNVHLGVTRQIGSNVGRVFVLQGENWSFVSDVHLVGVGGFSSSDNLDESSLTSISPMMGSIPYIYDGGSGGLSEPDSVESVMQRIAWAATAGLGTIVVRQLQVLTLIEVFALEHVSIGSPAAARLQFNRNLIAQNPISGIIYNQNNHPVSNLRVGRFGNGRDNGCGPISAHTAIFYAGRQGLVPDIVDIIHQLDLSGGLIAGGSLGANPVVIYDLIRQNTHSNTRISWAPPTSSLDNQIASTGLAVLLYIGNINTGYVHYVTIRHMPHLPQDERFWMYNLDYRDRPHHFPSINDWVISNNNSIPLALITIPLPVRIQTNAMPIGATGQHFSFQLQATGSPNIMWDYIGTVPQGLTFNRQTGLISGVPIQSGTFWFEVFAFNNNHLDRREFFLTIQASGPQPYTLELDDEVENDTVAYNLLPNFYIPYVKAGDSW